MKNFAEQFRLKRASIFTLTIYLSLAINSNAQSKNKPVNLLDAQLTHWYKWIGVPHTSVQGLPPGTPKGDGMNGTPMGMNDPKEVFKVINLDNEMVLKASGEIYGGLTTKEEYGNYHLHLQYKWGSKKWEPRLNLPRDIGIMFHLTGTNEDAFWSAFMMGLEFQISEGTTGDLFLVPNKTFSIFPVADVHVDTAHKWDINAPLKRMGGTVKTARSNRSENFESDSTKWTTLDLYTIGGAAVYLVNGHVVMAFQNAGLMQPDKSIIPLTKGKIQLQSEGAEGYYKDITVQTITDFPANIKTAAGFTSSSQSTSKSMIRHSVIFKFKADVSDISKHEFFNAAAKLATVEGVQQFEILKQTSPKNEYEFGLSMGFDNTEAYQKYNGHPGHTLFVQKYWLTMVEKFLEIDYEPIVDIASFRF